MDGQTARYEKWKACSPFLLLCPLFSHHLLLHHSVAGLPQLTHPGVSGPNQGNRWETNGFCLVHMREGDTLIRASVVGFTQRATAATSALPLPPLALYLQFYLRNVGMPRGRGWRDRESGIKGRGWSPWVLTGLLSTPTPSPEPKRIRALVEGQEAPPPCLPPSQPPINPQQ